MTQRRANVRMKTPDLSKTHSSASSKGEGLIELDEILK